MTDIFRARVARVRRLRLTPITLRSLRRRRRRGPALVCGGSNQPARGAGERADKLGRSRPSLFAAALLFSTRFGPDITLSALQGFNLGATNGWQSFGGQDLATGYTWPIDLWGGTIKLQVLVDTAVVPSTVGNYIQNEIQTVAGPNGRQTRALYQAVLRQGGGATQDPLLAIPHIVPGDVYISEWIKFQPDLAQKMGPNSWRVFFEWKTGPLGGVNNAGDYRLISYVYTDSSGNPYWFTHLDNLSSPAGTPYHEYWSQSEHGVPVPQGQWFKFEVYWHNARDSTGYAWEAINGQVVVDQYGPNSGCCPVNRIMIAQNYSGGTYDQKPAYQWVTDVQIWDGIPPSAHTALKSPSDSSSATTGH